MSPRLVPPAAALAVTFRRRKLAKNSIDLYIGLSELIICAKGLSGAFDGLKLRHGQGNTSHILTHRDDKTLLIVNTHMQVVFLLS